MSPDVVWVFVQKAFWFLVLIGVLISFHELGHFLAARLVGVRVLKFSLGFGPKLWGVQVGETEYVVAVVPLGGYVKMFGDEESEVLSPEEKSRSFLHQSIPRRMFIVGAGPAFNFILAYFIFVGWLATGAPLPVPTFQELAPDVAVVLPNSPADRAGIRIGDRIVRIDGREITLKENIFEALEASQGAQMIVDVRREDQLKRFAVTPTATEIEKDGRSELTYRMGIEGTPPVLTRVAPGRPAMAAGFKKGDRVVEIEGHPIYTWEEMTRFVRGSADRPLRVRVSRDGTLLDLTVTPTTRKRTPDGKPVGPALIGISHSPVEVIIEADNFLMASVEGVRATWKFTELIFVTLEKLITGEISRKNIAGPLGIASISGDAAEQGASTFIWVIALLSINLGVLNLLPIPILDGGHLLFFAIESILGRPLGERQREIAQRVGLVLLFCLMIFALYNDIERVFE